MIVVTRGDDTLAGNALDGRDTGNGGAVEAVNVTGAATAGLEIAHGVETLPAATPLVVALGLAKRALEATTLPERDGRTRLARGGSRVNTVVGATKNVTVVARKATRAVQNIEVGGWVVTPLSDICGLAAVGTDEGLGEDGDDGVGTGDSGGIRKLLALVQSPCRVDVVGTDSRLDCRCNTRLVTRSHDTAGKAPTIRIGGRNVLEAVLTIQNALETSQCSVAFSCANAWLTLVVLTPAWVVKVYE